MESVTRIFVDGPIILGGRTKIFAKIIGPELPAPNSGAVTRKFATRPRKGDLVASSGDETSCSLHSNVNHTLVIPTVIDVQLRTKTGNGHGHTFVETRT